jgi:hypothetical protein
MLWRRRARPAPGRARREASYALAPLPLEDGGAFRPGGPGMPDSTLTTSNAVFT